MNTENNQKIHFVTGKGGVGKSFFASALAYSLSQNPSEKPVLLAELSERSFYKDFFKLKDLSFKNQSLVIDRHEIDIALWTGQDCLKEYALHLLKIESLYKLFFTNPVSKALINVAPALQELAILGKATSHPRHHGPDLNYTNIVFDSFSTGHFLNLFRSPKAMSETIRFGPMGEQSKSIDSWIRNNDFCHVHIVTLAEEMPISETIDLYHSLKQEFAKTPQVYINKIISIDENDLRSESLATQTYFNKISAQQKKARERLLENNINFVEIDFVFDNDSTKSILQAADALRAKVVR